MTFSVSVSNTSPESMTLDSLSDDVYGDVTITSGNIVCTDCAIPQTIPAGGVYSCAVRRARHRQCLRRDAPTR